MTVNVVLWKNFDGSIRIRSTLSVSYGACLALAGLGTHFVLNALEQRDAALRFKL